MKISSSNGADASWSYRVKVKKNTEYRISAWVKTQDIAAGGYGVQLNLHELQMEGKTEPLRGTNDWTKIQSEFNSGNHESLLVNLLFGGWGRATGTAWFDDVRLVELIEPPVEMDTAAAAKFFEEKVHPILKQHCYECHGGGEKIRAEFVLTNRHSLIAGGESGEAIDLDSPADSLFLEAINYESYEMPPDGQLAAEEIEILTTWVKLGVPWSGTEIQPVVTEHKSSGPMVNAESKRFWSFQPVRRPPVPGVDGDWAANPIDQFIQHGLDQAGLKPNPPAPQRVLIRRVYYDLIGLPPTPAEVAEFVNDPDPDAYEKLIDRLLDSPH